MKLVETHANLLRSNASSAQKFEIINQNLQKSDLEKNSIFDFLLEHGIKNINNEKEKIGTVNSPHRIQSIISYIQNFKTDSNIYLLAKIFAKPVNCLTIQKNDQSPIYTIIFSY